MVPRHREAKVADVDRPEVPLSTRGVAQASGTCFDMVYSSILWLYDGVECGHS